MRHPNGRATEEEQLVAYNLGRIRREQRVTQTRVAEHLGVTFQQMQKFEGGASRISAGLVMELARFFGVEIMEFYRGIGNEAMERGRSIYADENGAGGEAGAGHRTRAKPATH